MVTDTIYIGGFIMRGRRCAAVLALVTVLGSAGAEVLGRELILYPVSYMKRVLDNQRPPAETAIKNGP
jgi:hypothetical protein